MDGTTGLRVERGECDRTRQMERRTNPLGDISRIHLVKKKKSSYETFGEARSIEVIGYIAFKVGQSIFFGGGGLPSDTHPGPIQELFFLAKSLFETQKRFLH